MKKLLGIVVLGLLVCNITFAKKNKNSWDYPLLAYKGWEIKGSENHYKFQSNLREDKNVLKYLFRNKVSIFSFSSNSFEFNQKYIGKSITGVYTDFWSINDFACTEINKKPNVCINY